jgi:hypothetical protein
MLVLSSRFLIAFVFGPRFFQKNSGISPGCGNAGYGDVHCSLTVSLFLVGMVCSSLSLPSLLLYYFVWNLRTRVENEIKTTDSSLFAFLVQRGCRTSQTSHFQKVGKPNALDSLEGAVVFWND